MQNNNFDQCFNVYTKLEMANICWFHSQIIAVGEQIELFIL